MLSSPKVRDFYNEYHGHDPNKLLTVFQCLHKLNKPIIFLLGDSSLDNKAWLNDKDQRQALNGYENILDPPVSKPDICYWINTFASSRFSCINCAVEESTLLERTAKKEFVYLQDEFVFNNLHQGDVLVVSVGGNDIALRPTLSTIVNMLSIIHLMPMSWIAHAQPDSSCWPWGLKYFVWLFKHQVETYLQSITSRVKPKLIVVCMIYYPFWEEGESWANPALRALKYNSNPERLQLLIQKVFLLATQQVRVPGCKIVPFALFDCLTEESDYVARVEPSTQGGRKIGQQLADVIAIHYE